MAGEWFLIFLLVFYRADPVTPRVQKLARDYWTFDLSEGDFENFGPHPAIYIRKPKTSTTLTEIRGSVADDERDRARVMHITAGMDAMSMMNQDGTH